jgi:hypothetical protein
MRRILFVFLNWLFTQNLLGSNSSVRLDTCKPHFDNFIDCQYNLYKVGFWVDTIGSTVPGKMHIHSWLRNQILMYGCWYDDTFHYSQNIEPTFLCGVCEYNDSAILSEYNLPSNSKIYKFYSIDDNTLNGHTLFDYIDRANYENLFNILSLDTPYCCDKTAPPEACSPCNCAIGQIEWSINNFAAKPARGIYWKNNCTHTY